jgi:GNAT superfamily N-acetyltransferase
MGRYGAMALHKGARAMTVVLDATLTVTTTYLELFPHDFRPAFVDDGQVAIMQARQPLPSFYRFLYGTVGRDYYWVDRLVWPDERLRAHLERPSISVDVLYYGGTPAGYVELERDGDEQGTEVAYFGLISAFHGRGLGKHLLSHGIKRALDEGAQRVWVHTCTLDGPAALPNYQARGFRIYKTTIDKQPVPSSALRAP